MQTFHAAGKWRLGGFSPKGPAEKAGFANKKWPVSHPGVHGFDGRHWISTEASGPTSTPNCGCDDAWPAAGSGCVSGGGVWRTGRSRACMGYWRHQDAARWPVCATANSTLGCVAGPAAKIGGGSLGDPAGPGAT